MQPSDQKGGCIGGSVKHGDNGTCVGTFGSVCDYGCEPGFGAAASHVCRESGRFEGGVCAPCPYGEWGEFGHCSACNECEPNGLLSAKHGKCTSTLGSFCIDPDAAWVLSTYSAESYYAAYSDLHSPIAPPELANAEDPLAGAFPAGTRFTPDPSFTGFGGQGADGDLWVEDGLVPPARAFPATWASPDGTLWMYGGWSRGANGSQVVDNDLWFSKLSPKVGVKGVKVTGVKLTQERGKWARHPNKDPVTGVENPRPSPRLGSISWQDSKGHFYLFGGSRFESGASMTDHFQNVVPFLDALSGLHYYRDTQAQPEAPGLEIVGHGMMGTPTGTQHDGDDRPTPPSADSEVFALPSESRPADENLMMLNTDLGGIGRSGGRGLGPPELPSPEVDPFAAADAASLIESVFRKHEQRSGLTDSNELWRFDGESWALVGGRNETVFDSLRLHIDVAKIDGSLYSDYITLQARWVGPPWPQARTFGVAWARKNDALMFGGLLSVKYLTKVGFNGGDASKERHEHAPESRWLLNDLWQYDGADEVTPWKLLGGSGISNHDPNTRGGMWVDDNGNLRSQDEDTREDGAWVGTKPGAHPSWASVDEAWTTPGEHATTATGATTGAPAMAAGHQLYQPIGDHEGALEQDAAGTLYRWPSPRMHAAGWVDANDAAWMFGGLLGCCDSTTQAQGVLVSELSTELWVVHGHHVFPVDPRMPGLNGYSGGWPRGAMSGGLTWAVVSMDDASVLGASRSTFLSMPGPRAAPSTWVDATGRFWLFGGVNVAERCDLGDLWVMDRNVGETRHRWLQVSSAGDVLNRAAAAEEAWPEARFGAVAWAGHSWGDDDGVTLLGGARLGKQCAEGEDVMQLAASGFGTNGNLKSTLNFQMNNQSDMQKYMAMDPDREIYDVQQGAQLKVPDGSDLGYGSVLIGSEHPMSGHHRVSNDRDNALNPTITISRPNNGLHPTFSWPPLHSTPGVSAESLRNDAGRRGGSTRD